MAFARFIARAAGRLLRAATGIVLVAVGFVVIEDSPAFGTAMFGIIPLLAGVHNLRLAAPDRGSRR